MKVIPTLCAILLIAVGISLPLPANSATMLTAKNGMTLYVFDKDTGKIHEPPRRQGERRKQQHNQTALDERP